MLNVPTHAGQLPGRKHSWSRRPTGRGLATEAVLAEEEMGSMTAPIERSPYPQAFWSGGALSQRRHRGQQSLTQRLVGSRVSGSKLSLFSLGWLGGCLG